GGGLSLDFVPSLGPLPVPSSFFLSLSLPSSLLFLSLPSSLLFLSLPSSLLFLSLPSSLLFLSLPSSLLSFFSSLSSPLLPLTSLGDSGISLRFSRTPAYD